MCLLSVVSQPWLVSSQMFIKRKSKKKASLEGRSIKPLIVSRRSTVEKILLVALPFLGNVIVGILDIAKNVIFRNRYKELMKKKGQIQEANTFSKQAVDITSTPLVFSKLLLKPDGTIDFRLAHDLEASFNQHDSLSNEIFSVIHQLEKDPDLCKKLQEFPLPKQNSSFEKAVRAGLSIPPEKALTQHDVRLVCLSSLLTIRSQKALDTCYGVSCTSYVKKTSLSVMLDDFKELALKDCITKHIGKELFTFPLQFQFFPAGGGKNFDPNNLSSLLKIPGIQIACHLLGCPKGEEEAQLLEAIGQTTVGAWDLTTALKKIAEKNNITQDKVDLALSYVYSIAQPPLLQLVENTQRAILRYLDQQVEFTNEYKEQKELIQKIKAFPKGSVDITSIPLIFSKLLLKPDGTIDFGFVHNLEPAFEQGDSVTHEIFSVLQKIEKGPALCKKLQNFPLPIKDSPFEKAVRAGLCIPPDQALTQHDVRLLCLTSLLTLWSQDRLGNCFAVSFCQHIKETSLHQVLDNLEELARRGCLTKKIEGKECDFPALLKFTPEGGGAHFDPADLSSLVKLPGIKISLHLLGCPEGQEEAQLLEAIGPKTVGTWDLTSAMKKIATKNNIAKDIVEQALSYVYSIAHPPLLQLIENGVTSMFFPPFTVPVKNPIQQRKLLTFAIIQLLRTKAEELKKSFEEKGQEHPFNEMEKELKQLFPTHIQPAGLDFTGLERVIDPHFLEMLLATDQIRQKGIATPYFEPLSCIRMASIPPPSRKESDVHLVLCEKTKDGFAVSDRAALGKVLQKSFLGIMSHICDGMHSPVPPDKIRIWQEQLLADPQFAPEQLVQAFQEDVQIFGEMTHIPTSLFEREGAFHSIIRIGSMKDLKGTIISNHPNLSEIYFTNQEFSDQNVSCDLKEENIISLMNLLKMHGSHVSSLPAYSESHCFRMLPNHFSVANFSPDTLQNIKEKMTTLFAQPLSSFPAWKKELTTLAQSLLTKKTRTTYEQEMETFLNSLEQDTWETALQKLKTWVEQKNSIPISEDDLVSKIRANLFPQPLPSSTHLRRLLKSQLNTLLPQETIRTLESSELNALQDSLENDTWETAAPKLKTWIDQKKGIPLSEDEFAASIRTTLFSQFIFSFPAWKKLLTSHVNTLLPEKTIRTLKPYELDSFLDSLKNDTWETGLQKLKTWIDQKKSIPISEDDLAEVIMTCCATNETLLHFADTNWFMPNERGGITKLHYAIGFNPRDKKWKVFIVPDIPDDSCSVVIEQFKSLTITVPKTS